MHKQKDHFAAPFKGLLIEASHTEPLEECLRASALPFLKLPPESSAEELLQAAKSLGDPKELLCLVETDEDERAAIDAGLFCIGYLSRERSGEKLSGCRILLEGFEEIDAAFLREVHTRALGLPITIAETERLKIREMTLSDLPELNALCRRNGFDEIGEEEARAYITYMYGLYQCGMWLVFEKKSGRLIGRCGFGVADYLDVSELDLGYLMDGAYRRQGYALEACRAVLTYGDERLQFPQISAYAEEENFASQALLEKLGFIQIQSFAWNKTTMHRYLRKAEYRGEKE